jgi:hypothetical protein
MFGCWGVGVFGTAYAVQWAFVVDVAVLAWARAQSEAFPTGERTRRVHA